MSDTIPCSNCNKKKPKEDVDWVDDTWVCKTCMSRHIANGGSPWESPVWRNRR